MGAEQDRALTAMARVLMNMNILFGDAKDARIPESTWDAITEKMQGMNREIVKIYDLLLRRD